MSAVIIFIAILGLLIFVHELGHFVVARRNDIRASEFGFGFPPRIFGVQVLSGKKMEKMGEKMTIESRTVDIKIGDEEVIKKEESQKVRDTYARYRGFLLFGRQIRAGYIRQEEDL